MAGCSVVPADGLHAYAQVHGGGGVDHEPEVSTEWYALGIEPARYLPLASLVRYSDH